MHLSALFVGIGDMKKRLSISCSLTAGTIRDMEKWKAIFVSFRVIKSAYPNSLAKAHYSD